jgi:hypothetical protein
VQVPEIQGIVGGSVKVSAAGSSASKVVYEGQVPLVFGFQAARLYYEQGRYTAFKPLQSGETAFESTTKGGDPRGDYLVSDSPFVRLDP